MFLIFEVMINMCRKPRNGQSIDGLWTGEWERAEYGKTTLGNWSCVVSESENKYRKLPLIWRSVK